jgi:hypothetical protein
MHYVRDSINHLKLQGSSQFSSAGIALHVPAGIIQPKLQHSIKLEYSRDMIGAYPRSRCIDIGLYLYTVPQVKYSS